MGKVEIPVGASDEPYESFDTFFGYESFDTFFGYESFDTFFAFFATPSSRALEKRG
jgi:hypothetical protein